MSKTLAALGLGLSALGAYRTYFHWGTEPGVSLPARLAEEGYRKLWQGQHKGSGGAVELFQKALVADAGSPYRWADLGAAYLEAGDANKARYCFEQARARSPRSPQILIRSANFALATGDKAAMVNQTALLLDVVPTHDENAFHLWEQMEISPQEALACCVRNNRRAHESFLRYLIKTRKLAEASPVWEKLSDPGPGLTADYAEALVQGGDPARAAAAHRRLGGSAILINGGFESEWSGRGLDWRVFPVAGVSVLREKMESGFALKVEFTGAENNEYRNVVQRVWIPAGGLYRLRARMRSEALTTDQGVALRVADGAQELARTTPVSGDSPWHDVQVALAVAGPRLVLLEVHRAKSWKFDGKPRGRVWIGDVKIEPGT